MRYNTLEAAIIRSGRGAPDSRPTPHVSVHLSQTVDPEQPESLTWWQRRWSVVESLPHVAIYLTNTAHTPRATVLRQPWFAAASCQRGEGGTTPTDFSFFSGVKFKSFILCLRVLGLDLLLYWAVVRDSEVSCGKKKRNNVGFEKQRYFSLYLRSALSRTPNCLLGCFHRGRRGAANPVFYTFASSFDVIIKTQIW